MHKVALVHITPNAEQLVAKMARVSNPANQDNPDSTGLIKYLIKHKHWSPFEMVNMCVQIDTTRSIADKYSVTVALAFKNLVNDMLR